MTIPALPATTPVAAATAAARTPDSAAREARNTGLVEIDAMTKQPLPPRFPWLSRLTRELEQASNQPSPYGSVPPLGENLDRKV